MNARAIQAVQTADITLSAHTKSPEAFSLDKAASRARANDGSRWQTAREDTGHDLCPSRGILGTLALWSE